MKFLLDTNFLLIPCEKKVDVFDLLREFGKPELYTLDACIQELRKTKYEDLVKKLIEKQGVKIEKALEGSQVDAEIERIAQEKGLTVCTQDRELIARLQLAKIPVITLRQGRYLIRL